MSEPLWVVRAGVVPYRRAWAWQRALVERRAAGDIPDTLLLLEHPHVYTVGKRGDETDVLLPAAALAAAGAEVVHTDRGGLVTYHGPGQLVGYPITLLPRAPDLLALVQRVLGALVEVAAEYGVTARVERGDETGMWVGDAKLAALGMRVSRRVTSHGFALNCETDLARFNAIVPCGLPDKGVCSLSTLTGRTVTVAEVMPLAERHLARSLDRSAKLVDLAALALPAEDYWPAPSTSPRRPAGAGPAPAVQRGRPAGLAAEAATAAPGERTTTSLASGSTHA
jgi:lipoyl(octanoyl) transferase